MWFFQNPEIIFYHFFRILNLNIFWVLILQKSIGSRYLVPLAPPTVFGWSFWNFTWAFRMAWRYACGFFRILNNFYHFFRILNLDIFLVLILQKHIGSRYLGPVNPTTVLSRSFWNFTGALRLVWRYACGFFRILKLFFITGFLLQYLGKWYRTNGPLVNLPIFNTSNKNKAGGINSPWNLLVSSVSSLSFIFVSPLSLSFIFTTIRSSISVLPFSGRWHKMTQRIDVLLNPNDQSIQNQESFGAESWYIALLSQGLPSLFKWWL